MYSVLVLVTSSNTLEIILSLKSKIWIYFQVIKFCLRKMLKFKLAFLVSNQTNFKIKKKSVLRNVAKFTGRHLCQSLFFNQVAGLRPATLLKKRLWHRCFPVNFTKFLRTPILTEHLCWLILALLKKKLRSWCFPRICSNLFRTASLPPSEYL